jgi:predicted nucleic acid-binding protein
MRRVIVPDTGVLGRVTNPRATPQNDSCSLWLDTLLTQDKTIVVVPEIADYELRREFLLGRKVRSLQRLDVLKTTAVYAPISTDALLLAADLWAQARRQGQKTADDKALDGDMILAAQTLLIAQQGDETLVATTNVRHLSLSLFVDAREWQAIPTS